MLDSYRNSFGRVVAVVYTGGTVAHVLRLLVAFSLDDMPFWVDWALVVLGSYGGIGLLVFARQVDYRGVWEKVVHGLIAAHLLASVAVHLWAIVAHSHAMFAVFPYGYSFFATAYFAAFAWRSWTMRLCAPPPPAQGDGVTKPRSKSWYRPRNVIVAIIAAIAVAWVTSMVRWWVTAVPAPVVDYAAELVELSESYQPQGEDGWALLVEAAAILPEVEAAIMEMEFEPRDGEAGFYLDFYRAYDPQFTDLEPERQALEMLRERGAFDRLAQAATRPRAVRPMKGATGPLVNVQLLPELIQFRGLAKARVASMCLALREGDGNEAAAALEQTLALARAIASQPLLIDRLVAKAIAALALSQLRDAVQEQALDEAACRALLDAIDGQLPLPPVELALEGERLLLLDAVQSWFTDDGHGDGRFDPKKAAMRSGTASGIGAVGRLQSMFLAGRAETTRVANEFFDAAVAESKLEPAARAASPFDAEAFLSRLSARHGLLKVSLPGLGRAIQLDIILHVQIEGTRLMLALEGYRARHGDYPVRLEQLVPELFRELPADPTHGGSFVYRLLDADPHRRGYLLYSTGLDQTDDSGTPYTGSDGPHTALLQPGQTGIDYVINQPRLEGD